jgi:hypothetical protein
MTIDVCRFVAGPAGNLCMSAVQGKLSIFIVRKQQISPTCSLMASLTGNGFLSRFEELTAMDVSMASGAILGQRLHPDLLADAVHFGMMTFQAEDFAMLPIKRESCQRMVKRRLMPGLRLMTISAAPFFDPQVDLPLMHIFVAIGAILIFQAKAGDQPPIFILDGRMTLIAGDGEMAAGQGIRTLLMGIKRVSRRAETYDCMASFAGAAIGSLSELI